MTLVAVLAAAGVAAREWPVWRDACTGRRALAAGRYTEARAAIERWLLARPGAAEAHFLKARVALAQGRRREFLDGVKGARAFGLPEGQVALLVALLDAQSGRHTHAEPVLRQAFLEAREPDPQLDEALARVYLETYNFRLAPVALRRWVCDAPGDPTPHLWLAQLHRRVETDPEVTAGDYREALKRDPNLAAARLGLAEELRKMYRNAEAAREYASYLALRPDDLAGHVGSGRNAFDRGDEATAIRHFDRALARDPGNAQAHREHARADLRRGDARAALGHLDQAVRLDPYDLDGHHSRALALTLLGRLDEAQAERLTAERLRAEILHLEDLRSRLVTSPDDRDLQTQTARWMFEHGYEQEGLRWARKILNDEPGQPETCRLLADYHERRGDAALANDYRMQSSSRPKVKPNLH